MLPQTRAPATPDTVVRNIMYSGHPLDIRECPDYLGVLMQRHKDRFVVGKMCPLH